MAWKLLLRTDGEGESTFTRENESWEGGSLMEGIFLGEGGGGGSKFSAGRGGPADMCEV